LRAAIGSRADPEAVKERGRLNCGVSQGLLGFSSMDDRYIWSGLDVDICRTVAAAIFDDPAKVTFTPLDTASRFTALQSNNIDVLSRNSTWTMSRESSLGLMFAGVAYYDGQGFVAPGCRDRYRPAAWRQDGLHQTARRPS
jgi:general L-amino acid transport system substrate-binding protein